MKPILMTEEFWANSQFSIARYYGQIKVGGDLYVIVDQKGRTLMECSIIAEKEGRDKAIEPGEPADLIREEFIPLYREYGRHFFIEVLKANPRAETFDDMKKALDKARQELVKY